MADRLSRRQFLARSSLTVAGGVAAAAAGPQVTSAMAAGQDAAPAAAPRKAEKAVVAYVRGGADGEVTLMSGDRKVVRRDPDLVRRLLNATD
jgi:hypothetical protein